MIKNCISLFLALAILTGCNPAALKIDPCVEYFPPDHYIKKMPSAFEPLTAEERDTDWGRELVIADNFAPDLDLYRAITGYKRALILLPPDKTERRFQIEYDILLCYYYGGKYHDAIETFEHGSLANVPADFPAFRDLLIILYEAYGKVCSPYKQESILKLIQEYDDGLYSNLELSTALINADFCQIQTSYTEHPLGQPLQSRFQGFYQNKLSVRRAQILNAVLPGAGYFYTGQNRTAITAFILNAAFIAATYELFHNGYPAAGAITASLEFGWYFGGINGAGLSAKYYNDQLYNCYAKDFMLDHYLFPVLMLEKSF
jgi:hypothetical protein